MSLSFLIFLSVLQGVTELFPVSSLGHTLLVPALFGMHIDKHAPQLLPFLVALHLGTAFALLWYFRTRWIALIGGFFASLSGRRNDDGHMMWALIIGTIPAGLVGLVLEKRLERVFHDLRIVAVALIVNGILLWLGDRLQRARAHRAPEKLTFRQAFLVGLAQVGALIPGFSRSGLTMIAGNGAGLTAEKAAEFSFLLGTPIIFAAGILELPKLFHAPGQLADALLGGVLTAIAAYLSVRFLMRYFEGRGRLASFGVYCVIAGVVFLGWFMTHPQPA
ncbi:MULTISPECIES: undecaprenyl-diphosphate phosphatase [Paraburkholderia]|uniref:Undecaprenyl-diphosphatase n=1 Tax=Paraburkholderia caribensis TaxID=75105 RepID=A0A9Q6RZA1_9BURK|nr:MULTISPECIES: undecaprenyl-diphosphate phosphatase [Paraburkholderia]MCO4881579.1 undecaprenyl-diphosphate phosphatase [Paraburkholderia caribensis]PTB23733.1 undecaprenyl-diphosphatase [Paraburkholderia caribensis]QLB61631.1 undecaprenyl-diphosphatase [Paraburkholderia caribensis]CAG9205917.1 Undecaprenyl-diphosphatase 2 [Paraburkholderia caribensis]